MPKRIIIPVLIITAVVLGLIHSEKAGAAEDQKFTMGTHGGVFLGSGEPANDIPTFGVYGRYHLKKNWNIGLSADYMTGDFERPYKILKIPSEDENDSTFTNLVFTLWGEYNFDFNNGRLKNISPFLAAGLGFGIIDVDDVKEDTPGQRPYDISTDAGTEIIPALSVGLRYHFSRNWELELSATGRYHLAEWDVEDRVSGKKETIDDYMTYGFLLGIGFNF